MNRGWIEAALALDKDPAARVRCPTCEAGELGVKDVRATVDPEVIERFLTCGGCGAGCAIRMRRTVGGATGVSRC